MVFKILRFNYWCQIFRDTRIDNQQLKTRCEAADAEQQQMAADLQKANDTVETMRAKVFLYYPLFWQIMHGYFCELFFNQLEPTAKHDNYSRFERMFANVQLQYEAHLDRLSRMQNEQHSSTDVRVSCVETDRSRSSWSSGGDMESTALLCLQGQDVLAIDFTAEMFAAMDEYVWSLR